MTSRSPAPLVTTPDGQTGTVLHFPQSGYFRILRDGGRDVEQVEVTPVLLDGGEVRLYASASLGRG